jgi:hypothetical protein
MAGLQKRTAERHRAADQSQECRPNYCHRFQGKCHRSDEQSDGRLDGHIFERLAHGRLVPSLRTARSYDAGRRSGRYSPAHLPPRPSRWKPKCRGLRQRASSSISFQSAYWTNDVAHPATKLALRSVRAGMMVRAAPTRVIDAGSVARRCSARASHDATRPVDGRLRQRCLKDHSRRQLFANLKLDPSRPRAVPTSNQSAVHTCATGPGMPHQQAPESSSSTRARAN